MPRGMVPDLAATPESAQDLPLPALTGLRFIAAISVALAHCTAGLLRVEPESVLSDHLRTLAFFGMTLFFVLSGFVIHYNYRRVVTAQGWTGIASFLWARFARLYPLFLFMLVLDIVLGRRLFDFILGNTASFSNTLRALPYFLLFAQSWANIQIGDTALIHATDGGAAVTWSISTEWFFYLVYPVIAWLTLRARNPACLVGAMLIWSLLWGGMASALDRSVPGADYWAILRYSAPSGSAEDARTSFIHWLEYFSPYVRIGEFILGCLTAQLYLELRRHAVTKHEQALGGLLLVAAMASVPFILYLSRSEIHRSPLLFSLRYNYALAPSTALLLFGATRYENGIARFLRRRPLVALGEASYSIYLTHILILGFIPVAMSQALPATAPNVLAEAARRFPGRAAERDREARRIAEAELGRDLLERQSSSSVCGSSPFWHSSARSRSV